MKVHQIVYNKSKSESTLAVKRKFIASVGVGLILAAALLFAGICLAILGGGLALALLGVPPRFLSPSDSVDLIALGLLILFPMLALAPLFEWWFKLWYSVDTRLMAFFFVGENVVSHESEAGL